MGVRIKLEGMAEEQPYPISAILEMLDEIKDQLYTIESHYGDTLHERLEEPLKVGATGNGDDRITGLIELVD